MRANAPDAGIYERAAADPEGFWEQWARELDWFEPWEDVLRWDPPQAQWFAGGKLDVSYNCLDRHLSGPRRNKAALIWEGEPGEQRVLTYWDLYREVSRFAYVMKGLGVKQGDRVAIHLPMIPEAAIAMLLDGVFTETDAEVCFHEATHFAADNARASSPSSNAACSASSSAAAFSRSTRWTTCSPGRVPAASASIGVPARRMRRVVLRRVRPHSRLRSRRP